MELVPIIYRMLLISGVFFFLVLAISFIMSKFKKRQSEENHIELIEERKRAHALEQRLYYERIKQAQQALNQDKEIAVKSTKMRNNDESYERKVMRKTQQRDPYFRRDRNSSPGVKPRYEILNDQNNQQNDNNNRKKELNIIYPIDYQRSA